MMQQCPLLEFSISFYINNPGSILMTNLLTYLCFNITLSTYCLIKFVFIVIWLLLSEVQNDILQQMDMHLMQQKKKTAVYTWFHLFI